MDIKILAIILCLFTWLQSRDLGAAPTFSLSSSLSSSRRSLQILVSPSESAESCLYTLLASGKRSNLNRENPKGRTLVSTAGEAQATLFTASRLPRTKLRNKTTKLPIYFILKAVCDGEKIISNISKVTFKNSAQGKSITDRSLISIIRSKVSNSNVTLFSAFPSLSFSSPVDLQHAGDGSNMLYVLEQGGKVYSFQNSAQTQNKTLFLDISSRVETGGQEQGLLGLAFHPQFKSNGFFYVNYSEKNSGRPTISRFHVASGANSADVSSELNLLTIEHPFSNHNGGGLAFGPDGHLYITSGDGGGGGDPQGNGQKRTTLLGKILRIDVNSTSSGKNYAIPSDNPYAGNTQGFKEEIYAYGLRNPWRLSFDSVTGKLWVGDVGQSAKEEVHIIEKGKNYGWNIMEGSICYPPPATDCNKSGLELPIVDYGRSLGISITGGYVYRGSNLKALVGNYIYGDFGSGRIWAVSVGSDGKVNNSLLLDSDLTISSFGTDEQKELYVLSYSEGLIYKITTK